jgi:hypothetical protein
VIECPVFFYQIANNTAHYAKTASGIQEIQKVSLRKQEKMENKDNFLRRLEFDTFKGKPIPEIEPKKPKKWIIVKYEL